ncbi:MAG TPA: hypothetical protein VFC19_33065 [Candidatus Limnocylindrales bacterium]|nr:hypothetical protein [Candidatus Limnocylindrales bacterium]
MRSPWDYGHDLGVIGLVFAFVALLVLTGHDPMVATATVAAASLAAAELLRGLR